MGSPCAQHRCPVCTHDLPGILSPTLPCYTCMSLMEVDPEQSDTLMHLSGYIFLVAINAALRGKGPNSRTWKRESVAVHLSHPLVIPHIIPPPPPPVPASSVDPAPSSFAGGDFLPGEERVGEVIRRRGIQTIDLREKFRHAPGAFAGRWKSGGESPKVHISKKTARLPIAIPG